MKKNILYVILFSILLYVVPFLFSDYGVNLIAEIFIMGIFAMSLGLIIDSRRHIKVDNLSYGEQRLLEVLLAMASKPKLLLLDEPTSGMSPAETAQTSRIIQNLPRTMAVVVIEHDMEVVFSIADRITVLHHGEVILSGAPEEIRNNEIVKEIYFGGGAKAHA